MSRTFWFVGALPAVAFLSLMAVSTARAEDTDPSAVLVSVQVPPDAEVWFGDTKTKMGGAERAYVSPPLKPGMNFIYDIRARWMEQGKPVDWTRHITVRAGDKVQVRFGADTFTGSSVAGYPGTSFNRPSTIIVPVYLPPSAPSAPPEFPSSFGNSDSGAGGQR